MRRVVAPTISSFVLSLAVSACGGGEGAATDETTAATTTSTSSGVTPTSFAGCTTHLSTAGETALAQCMDVVGGPLATAAASGPAVLAGDWNLKYKGDPDAQDCVPGGFYRKGDGSVQHVIASDDLTFLETIVIDMDGTTDHPGLEVRLTLP